MNRQWGTYTKNLVKMEWFKLRIPTEPKLYFPIDISYLLFLIPTSLSL